VIEEVDLLDPNDLLLDHTFTEEEIQSGHVLGSGGGVGGYRFGIFAPPEAVLRR
jgi:hypothetical protein